MKKILYLLFTLISCSTHAQNNQNTDSIKAVIDKTPASANKTIQLYRLALQTEDPELKLKICKQALLTADSFKLEKIKGDLIGLTAITHADMGDYVSAFNEAAKALKIARIYNDTTNFFLCINTLGKIFENGTNYERAVQYYYEGLNVALKYSDSDRYFYYAVNIAELYKTIGNYNLSFSILKPTYIKALSEKKYNAAAKILVIIAKNMLEKYSDDYYSSEIKKEKFCQVLTLLRYSHLLINKSLNTKNPILSCMYTCMAKTRIKLYDLTLRSDQLDSAELCINRTICADSCFDSNYRANIYYYQTVGELYLARKNYKMALEVTDSFEVSYKHLYSGDNSHAFYEVLYRMRANAYECMGKYKKALDNLKLLTSLSNKNLSDNELSHLSGMRASYLNEKMINESELVELRTKLQNEFWSKTRWVILICITLILFVSMFFWLRMNKLKKTVAMKTKTASLKAKLENKNSIISAQSIILNQLKEEYEKLRQKSESVRNTSNATVTENMLNETFLLSLPTETETAENFPELCIVKQGDNYYYCVGKNNFKRFLVVIKLEDDMQTAPITAITFKSLFFNYINRTDNKITSKEFVKILSDNFYKLLPQNQDHKHEMFAYIADNNVVYNNKKLYSTVINCNISSQTRISIESTEYFLKEPFSADERGNIFTTVFGNENDNFFVAVKK